MKYKHILVVCLISFIAITCSRNSDPTSPNNKILNFSKGQDSALVSLKYYQKVIMNEELIIHFRGVTSDSRCPPDVDCIWAGDGEVKLNISKDGNTKEILIHTNLDPKYFDFEEYQIVLKTLSPYPKSTETIKQEDYTIELEIKHNDLNVNISVILIEGNDDSVIKHDMLNVNSVTLDNDVLKFEIGYSGGCKNHTINLYAYKAIQKSNPAQVTLILSHDADNDVCEAFITKEIKFDLNVLKDFLERTYNIQDKVILLLFDPSGKPLRSPVIEYNF